jgi:two-component system, NtrC family, response regulator HydG
MTGTSPLLLVVDDEPPILDILGRFAAKHGFEVVRCNGGRAALDTLRHRQADMALVDVRMPDINGLDVLKQVREVAPDCAVVLMTGFAAVDTAVEAIKLGAVDYLSKPIDYDRLTALFETVREQTERRRRLAEFDSGMAKRLEFHGMVGRSPVMEDMFSLLRRLAPHARTALITGETGSGKELVARALHDLGPRHQRRFVTVNCSAVVPTLFESELFGHVRGAFTGATDTKAGLFEHADSGTLFLDEIGELPMPVQSKLLRVLETGEVQRVGALEPRRVDVHILAATNRDLRAECTGGNFRSDLFYRLNVVELRVPSLRERRDDVPFLVAAFRQQFANNFRKPIEGVTPGAERMLIDARWDGNVRELRNTIERACMLAEGRWITERELTCVMADQAATGPIGPVAGTGARPGPVPVSGGFASAPPAGGMPSSVSGTESLSAVERDHIVRTLEQVHGNKSLAARALGLSRRRLYRLIERHGLDHLIQRREGEAEASPDAAAVDAMAEDVLGVAS